MNILECKALTKRYGGKSALEGVELSIEPGRIVGLLGPNGSGKTTLIKLANGLLTPTSGEILIDGKAPSPETKAIVSYLPDRNALPDWMTVAQTVDYYADFYADFRRDAAQEMLARLGLDAHGTHEGGVESIRVERARGEVADEPVVLSVIRAAGAEGTHVGA